MKKVLGLLVLAGLAWAANLYVPGSYTTIQEAINAAHPSQTKSIAVTSLSRGTKEGMNWPLSGYDLQGSYYVPVASLPQTLSNFNTKAIINKSPSYTLVGDVNGDGQNEIVFKSGNVIYIADSLGNIKNTINTSYYLSSLLDINSDGVLDISVGTGLGDIGLGRGEINFYSATGSTLWSFSKSVSYDGGIAPLYLLDGKLYVMNDAGYGRTPRGVSRVNISSKQEEWFYSIGPHFWGGLPQFSLYNDRIALNSGTPHNGATGNGYNGNGATTDDGNLWHIVIDSSGNQIFTRKVNNANTDGSLVQRILPNGNIIALESHWFNPYWGTAKIHLLNPGGNEIATRNRGLNVQLNAAFNSSVVVVGGQDGVIEVLSPNDLVVQSSKNIGTTIWIAGINDIDGDGSEEIIAYTPSKVYIYSMNLIEEWNYTSPSGEIRNVQITDITGDGKMDIIVSTTTSLFIISQ
ncbi:MAG: VCBS repeat-containing protein, partial [bacterium]